MRLVQALAGLMLLCCSALPTRANPPPDKILDQRHRFDIHVQPLSGALRQLSAQTGVRILFPYEEVSAIRSRRIDGWMTTGQALQKLLAGTHLRMTQTSAGVIALAAPPRATARQSPLSFQLSQAASPPPPVTDPTPIIVTGTRLVTRTIADSMTPIDIVSARDLEANGRQSVRDLLGALIPAINVSNSGAGASFAIKTLSLRGLAGDHLLVLVNGKRRHNSATLFINGTTQNGQSPPDLDLIPSNMIERIEVLRDGASAHYGSDAIAGVVNILLKSDSRGGASVMGGGAGDGGGEQGRFQVDKGFAVGPGTIHLAADGVPLRGPGRPGPAGRSPPAFISPAIRAKPRPTGCATSPASRKCPASIWPIMRSCRSARRSSTAMASGRAAAPTPISPTDRPTPSSPSRISIPKAISPIFSSRIATARSPAACAVMAQPASVMISAPAMPATRGAIPNSRSTSHWVRPARPASSWAP